MADVWDELIHFSKGIVTSAEADRSDLKNALIRGENSQFTSLAGGMAQIRKRKGMSLVNATPLDNAAGVGPAIIAGYPYKYVNPSTGVVTRYTIAVTATGNAHVLVDDGATTTLTPTASLTAALATGIVAVDGVEMNNRLFLLDNLAGQASLLNTAEVAWGVPTVTGLTLAASAAGGMTGTYDVVVTAWNDTTKAESDRSLPVEVTLTANNLQITVNSVAAALTNMYFRVYLRKQTLGSGLWRVLTRIGGEAFVAGDVQGFDLSDAAATKTVTINITDAVLEDLVIAPPQINARGIPPVTAKYAAVFQRRLFLADDSRVYWSELDLPDAFNPLNQEPFVSPRGGAITGIVPMANGQGLHIFTESGRHSIIGGADPTGWTIDIEDPALGNVARRSLVSYRKFLAAWDADHGPILLSPSGDAAYIGTDFIRASVHESVLNTSEFGKWLGAAHDGRIFFGVVEGGATKVQRILVFNVEVGAWESTNWDPMDAASLFVSYDSANRGHVYLGNYNGQLFRLLNGGTDGVRAGVVRGTFVAAATSVSSITSTDPTFDITGAGLRQRRVRLVNAAGVLVENARVHIASNTASVLTLSGSISGLTVGATYTFLIGGPNFVAETYWGNMGRPFVDKRFDVLYSEFRVDEGVANVNMKMAFAWDVNRTTSVSSFDSSSSLWDDAEWDVAVWDGTTEINRRLPVLKRGFNYRVQLRNPYPNQGFTVLKLAVLARELSDRYAGNALRAT